MSCQHGNPDDCEQCAEIDAAWKRGYEAGGKLSVDLTMQHLRRAEKAEAEAAALREMLENPSPELIKNCARRLLRFQDGSSDESFNALQWAEVKQDAERVIAELNAAIKEGK